MQNGPEWTISATWNGAGDAVVLTLVARPRLGTASSMPNAQFRYPGNVRDYNQDESHAEGEGGNAVTAIGTGQGAAQPSAVARDETRIAVEGRWESVTQSAAARTAGQLTAAAAAELALEVGGKTLFTLLADATLAPRFGIDWVFGDDVALVVDRDALSDNAPSYGHPNGLNTVARAIGWTLDIDADTIAPVLWQSSEGALT